MGGSHRAELTIFDPSFIYGKREGCHRSADPTQHQYTGYRVMFYGILEPTTLYGSIIECLLSRQPVQPRREHHQVHHDCHRRLPYLNYNLVPEVQQSILLAVSSV